MTTTEMLDSATGYEAETSGRHWLDLANQTTDPLECIAMALTGLLAVQVHAAEANDTDDLMATQLDASTDTITELSNTLEAVRQVVGKSTAGWADKIRTALGDAPAEEPAPGPEGFTVVTPARDADVEEWRAFARAKGYTGPDVDGMNRSQIRTMLGISNG